MDTVIVAYFFFAICLTGILFGEGNFKIPFSGEGNFNDINGWRFVAAILLTVLTIPILFVVELVKIKVVKLWQLYEVQFYFKHYVKRTTYSEDDLESIKHFRDIHKANPTKVKVLSHIIKIVEKRMGKV